MLNAPASRRPPGLRRRLRAVTEQQGVRVSRDSRRAAFASALKRARTDAGLSQRQLAARSGVHYTAVSQWELAKRSPTEDQVATLEGVLSLPRGQLGWIFGYASPPAMPTPEDAIQADPTLSDREKRAFLAALAEVRKINEEDS
jgi:transcriptional regulator with XRE-family HTH domain